MPPIHPQPFPFGQVIVPNIIKKPKGESCTLCGNIHDNMGTYLCLGCGNHLCARSSIDLITETVMHSHERMTWSNRRITCGPAVRVQASYVTVCTIKKAT